MSWRVECNWSLRGTVPSTTRLWSRMIVCTRRESFSISSVNVWLKEQAQSILNLQLESIGCKKIRKLEPKRVFMMVNSAVSVTCSSPTSAITSSARMKPLFNSQKGNTTLTRMTLTLSNESLNNILHQHSNSGY